MKMLVTGASGFLGSSIIARGYKHEIIGTYYSSPIFGGVYFDISDVNQVRNLLKKVQPQILVHSASMRNNAVEANHESGSKVNVQGTSNLVEVCNELGIFLIYVSSDLIFDGKKGCYTENDHPSPVSFFGQTKMQAEAIISKLYDSCIARTSLLFGWDKRSINFATMIINNLRLKKTTEVVADQFVSPSYVENVADMILEICERRLRGTFNVAGSSRVTRFYFARQIAEVFELDSALLNPITMDKMKWDTKRGNDCSLDVSLVKRVLKIQPISSLDGLMMMRREEK